ncbi:MULTISPECIES: heavy metal sensor histidine kinase [Vibrio]|uniref:heavy metal sensor histidine kinase n=1 Tax=Vibrio TaxID=662 RepID=UPI001FCC606A|nr:MULTISPECIES: heavy metal sensor histidine kinase [Vibrio]
MRFLTNSITGRLVLSYFAASIVVLCVLSTATLYSLKHHFYQQDYFTIEQKFQTIDKLRVEGDFIAKFGEFFETGDTKLWLISDGKLMYQSQNVPLPEGLLASKSDRHLEWVVDGKQYRAQLFSLENSPGIVAVLGFNIDHQVVFIQSFTKVLILTTIIASIISGVLGWLIAQKELKPLKRLEQHVNNTSTNQLDLRIPTNHFPKELMPLVIGFNAMLDRLEGDFERLSDFSSDIAHELRTPIGNMMTQTQVALSKPRTTPEYQDILVSNVEELQRITKTMTDILYLAKSEHNLLLKTNQQIELKPLLEDMVEFYELAGEEKTLSFTVVGESTVLADKTMLKRALSNLLSNAVRHSHMGSVVDVTMTHSETHNFIAVSNLGDSIPEDSLPLLFDRFYRVDKSRVHNSSSGAGLGLSITRSIAKLHGGDITVRSESGKTTFTLSLAKPSN